MGMSDSDSEAGADVGVGLGVAGRRMRCRFADNCNGSSFTRGRFELGVLDGDRWVILIS
jgi:hypothetical protein